MTTVDLGYSSYIQTILISILDASQVGGITHMAMAGSHSHMYTMEEVVGTMDDIDEPILQAETILMMTTMMDIKTILGKMINKGKDEA